MESGTQLARHIVEELTAMGHQAYWVGGCVRDRLLGFDPKDYDVATSALPEAVLELFAGSALVGASFGVVLVPGGVEVATFRSEANYSDGRRPDHVQYETDPARDAARRDFTINALYYDPIADAVLDFFGGQEDLKAGVIRAIGDGRLRFAEDHLRLLRAVRFAARFGYTIEAQTLAAIVEMAPLIRRIAPERINEEMRLILTGRHLDQAWHWLESTGLRRELVPEGTGGARLARLEPPVSAALGWAALLEGVADCHAVAHRYRFSREEIAACSYLLENEARLFALESMPMATQKRLVRAPLFDDEMRLHRATHGESGAYRFAQGLQKIWTHEDLFPPALLHGQDLIGLGIPPGSAYRDILTRVEDAQLEGRIATREEALRLALA